MAEQPYLGTDAYFDFTSGDYAPLPAGDLGLVSGEDVVLQDVWMRLVTPRGDLWCHPGYGVDIYPFIQCENTLMNRMALCSVIREEVREDPRVNPESVRVWVREWSSEESAVSIGVSFTVEESTNRMNLVVGYDLRGVALTAVRG